MGASSKRKGKSGELECSKEISKCLNIKARRGVQYSGGADSPDLVTDLQHVHFEVKRTESLRLWDAMQQAKDDAGDKVPVVMHRKNRKPWLAICCLEDLHRLAMEIASITEQNAIECENKTQ